MPAACLLPPVAKATASVVKVTKLPLPANIVGKYKAELTEKPIVNEATIGNSNRGILMRNNLFNLPNPKLAPNIS